MLKILFPFLLINTILFSQENIEIKRYKAPQAKQGVVANKDYFIVFSNDSIVKYDKITGKMVGSIFNKNLIHLNSGVIKDGKIYCAHSNYPGIPMWSSIEVFDEKTLEHIESHSFGIENGSCTWLDIYDNHYYVMFAQYANLGKMEPNKNVSWSQLVKYDKDWRRIEAWVLPPALVEHLTPYSLSGGVIMQDGRILATHHHHQEIYVLSFPKMGAQLVWEKTIPTNIHGQAIAFDTFEKDVLWGINKETMEVIKTKFVWE